MLTPMQASLLRFISEYQRRNGGVSPTFEEMAKGIGVVSKSGIHRLITALEERGFIRRIEFRARAIDILKMPKWDSGALTQTITAAASFIEDRTGKWPSTLVISRAHLAEIDEANTLVRDRRKRDTEFLGMKVISYPWTRDWELLP